MSRYTTEVRFICETAAGLSQSKGGDDVETIITAAAPHVFNFDFPIYNEEYRLPLERKILRHYYTREICAETVGLWKLWLNDKMNMIMPYYNKLYESADLEFNPFHDVDVTTEHTKENEGATTGETTESGVIETGVNESVQGRGTGTITDAHTGTITDKGTGTVTDAGTGTISDSGSVVSGTDWQLFSDTPQGGIQGVENATILQESPLADFAYLTTAEKDIHNRSGEGSNTRTRNTQDQQTRNTTDERTLNNTDTRTRNTTDTTDTERNVDETRNVIGTTEGTVANTEEFLEHIFGKRGHHTYSAMLMEYRKSLINIDAMIIEELEDLFFKLWD